MAGLVFTAMLLKQHYELVCFNYTTNEGINWHKYRWFVNPETDGARIGSYPIIPLAMLAYSPHNGTRICQPV